MTDPSRCGATPGCGIGGTGSAGTACKNGLVCNGGTCAVSCPGTEVNCSGTCVDPTNDPTHCGATNGCGVGGAGSGGTACVNGQVCSSGACGASCTPTQTNCSGSCVDTKADPSNCGGCAMLCALAHVTTDACVNGECAVDVCAAGFSDCDGMAANGCETATKATDIDNCGGCGVTCHYANAAATCTAGACALGACQLGFADCDGNPTNGCETNTAADVANCGACNNACSGGQVCSSSACTASCAAGQTNCSGSCVNTTVNEQHCGSCTTSCALPNVTVNACASSSCVVGGCAAGFGDCDGVAANGCETATGASDANNCGGCGVKCSYPNAGATCSSGACALGACQPGFADCDGNPANGCETNTAADVANCGTCKNACGGGQVCSAGICGTTCGGSTTNCSSSCVTETTDVNHCGSCTNVCALPSVSVNACSASKCVVGACAAGFGDCDGVASNGCETATHSTDVNNCGGCGIRCSYPNAGATCATGACAIGACAPGFADCDGNPANGCEVNTQADNGNCGSCGTACGGGQVCSAGACGTTCGGTTTDCSSSCVAETTDVNHCGSCTNACALPNVSVNACSASNCVVGACAAGYGDCDGVASNGCETATHSTDVNNCGGCGIRCSYPNAGATCSTGTCTLGACAGGFADCDGNPANGCEVNTQADNANCGGCGTACGGGQVCSAGSCGTTCGGATTDCSSSCVTEASDVSHCGSCTNACALPNVSVNACSASKCVVGACAIGFGDCNGFAADGCETATHGSDVNNCGGCGIRCSYPNAGATCATGTCAIGACAAGFADCDGNPGNGCEVNTQADNGNCGSCGNSCGGGKVCSAGSCGTTCGGGLTNCSGACADLTSSPADCGMCNNLCPTPAAATAVCAASNCAYVCQHGFLDCDGLEADGCEVNSSTDSNNCGTCGNRCTMGPCSGGICHVGYTIGGTVSGLTGTDLVLQDNGGDNLTINANGTFTFATAIDTGGMYAVTVFAYPSPAQICTVNAGGSGTVTNANVTTVSIVCFSLPAGGTITTSGGFRIHTFMSAGTFQTYGPMTVSYLVVAGGGGGGSGDGAGGGAGGVLMGSAPLALGSFSVVVGAGGVGAGRGEIGTPSGNGFDSTFAGLDSVGGGRGGQEDNTGGGGPLNFGGNGGSGGGFGGANAAAPFPAGGSGTAGQGFSGGTRGSAPNSYGMGGGGGAGGPGGNGSSSNNGGGGGGGLASSISGATGSYGGGGGGSGRGGTGGAGGNGGGGAGGPVSGASGAAAQPNTGGGGGGGGDQGSTGGAGGSGVVIIAYPTSP